jgi:hypothetical protein
VHRYGARTSTPEAQMACPETIVEPLAKYRDFTLIE